MVVRICHDWTEAAAHAELPDRIGVESTAEREGRFRLYREHDLGLLSNEEYFERVAALYGYRCSAEEVARLHRAILIGEHDGVHSVVAAAKERGLSTACLSNTNAFHWDVMHDPAAPPDRWRAFRALDQKLASHLLGMAKPDRQIYDSAARMLGAAPEEILFFDDREENIAAAREAGWRAEVVQPGLNPAEQIAAGLRRHGVEL